MIDRKSLSHKKRQFSYKRKHKLKRKKRDVVSQKGNESCSFLIRKRNDLKKSDDVEEKN